MIYVYSSPSFNITNFYNNNFNQNWNITNNNFNSNQTQTGHNILSFSNINNDKNNSLLSIAPFSNNNLICLNTFYITSMGFISKWASLENYNFLEHHLINIYEYKLWGNLSEWSPFSYSNAICFNWFNPTASLIFCLNFTFQIIQYYLLTQQPTLTSGTQLTTSYWNSFSNWNTFLSLFKLGDYFQQGEFQEFKFSNSSKGSIIMGAKNNLFLISLPSEKLVWLSNDNTSGTLGKSLLTPIAHPQFNNNASIKSYWGSNPTVSGNAMNVFNHPNGGFKHSSKMLSTFAGNSILN